MRSTVQITLFGCATQLFASRCADGGIYTRSQSGENRIESLNNLGLATDHLAIATLQAPDATAGAAVDIMNVVGLQFFGAANVVMIIRVAAVDDDITCGQQGDDLRQGVVYGGCRYH